jgi:hypothetical protein
MLMKVDIPLRISLLLISVGLLMAATALMWQISMAADDMSTKREERTVTYERMGAGDYQSFLGNWDEKDHAVLYAFIQKPAHYAALFHPSATMGDKRPFAPGADFYTTEQILVVARVTAATENMDRIFEVERITERDHALELHYLFHEPKTNAECFVKNYLAVRIPRHEYETVTFFENGKQVGQLDTAEGQWSVPAMTLKP